MALEPQLWALKDAPVADTEEKMILIILAEVAGEDGCAAFLSQTTIAERAMLSRMTVHRKMKALEDRGLLRRGNQEAAQYIRVDHRPVVYDLAIPVAWFPNLKRVNEYRAMRGLDPLVNDVSESYTVKPDKPLAVYQPVTGSVKAKDLKRDTTYLSVAQARRQEQQADDDLDPTKFLADEDASVDLRPADPGRLSGPGPDTSMGLATYWVNTVERYATTYAGFANRKALAANIKRWLVDGVTGDEVRAMADLYAADAGMRDGRKVAWIDFCGKRQLLITKVRENAQVALRDDPAYWEQFAD